MGMGLNIEVEKAEDWPPIAGIPEWLSKYWPVLVVGGIGTTLLTFWWIKKK